MRYPNAADVERVAEALQARPATVGQISRECGMPAVKVESALKALRWQGRAVGLRDSRWRARA